MEISQLLSSKIYLTKIALHHLIRLFKKTKFRLELRLKRFTLYQWSIKMKI